MNTNFNKTTVKLHYFHIISIFTKFQDDQRSIAMSLVNCLYSSFYNLKQYINDEFINWIINNIWLIWKLTCMLKIYKICNPMMKISKYETNNKLLDSVTLLMVT